MDVGSGNKATTQKPSKPEPRQPAAFIHYEFNIDSMGNASWPKFISEADKNIELEQCRCCCVAVIHNHESSDSLNLRSLLLQEVLQDVSDGTPDFTWGTFSTCLNSGDTSTSQMCSPSSI